MSFADRSVGDLVKLINGAPGEKQATWRIKDYLVVNQKVELEKYNSPDALPRKMTVEKDNVRKLTDGELDNLAIWSRQSFVRTTIRGESHIGKVLRIDWDCKKGFLAEVHIVGKCIPKGIQWSGDPCTVSISTFRENLEEAKLVACTRGEIEWLRDYFARLPSQQQEQINNPRAEFSLSKTTFDDFLHQGKIKK